MTPDPSISVEVNIIAWFTPRRVDIEKSGKTYRVRYCRVCEKEITRHVLLDEGTATPDELAEASEASHRDGETFFTHLYTAHRAMFGDEDPVTDFMPN